MEEERFLSLHFLQQQHALLALELAVVLAALLSPWEAREEQPYLLLYLPLLLRNPREVDIQEATVPQSAEQSVQSELERHLRRLGESKYAPTLGTYGFAESSRYTSQSLPVYTGIHRLAVYMLGLQ